MDPSQLKLRSTDVERTDSVGLPFPVGAVSRLAGDGGSGDCGEADGQLVSQQAVLSVLWQGAQGFAQGGQLLAVLQQVPGADGGKVLQAVEVPGRSDGGGRCAARALLSRL